MAQISSSVRRGARRALVASRLPAPILRSVWRAYERALAWREPEPIAAEGDLPLPPKRLRVLVSGTADPDFFLGAGRAQAAFFTRLLQRNGIRIGELEALLDFGCGCGRITRWWADLDGPQIHACDYNPELVAWCSENLPFVLAAVNRLEPPLPYEADRFDFAYALSVFTHLREEKQRPWLEELGRVLRPGAPLLFTVSGEAYADQLEPDERAAYDRAELVVRFGEVEGTNMCTVRHPPASVERMLADAGWAILERVSGSGQEPATGMVQDTYLATSFQASSASQRGRSSTVQPRR
jgi:SAM-dependent methyltransferase